MKMLAAFAGLLAIVAAQATAQEAQPTPVPISDSQRYVLHSEAIGQDFTIDVAMPANPTEGPLPVIYVMDGNLMLPLVANTARALEFGQEIPPAIIVGIGYTVDFGAEVIKLRTRDLTPTKVDAMPGQADGEEPLATGGASAFLDFIAHQVKPFIAANYNVDGDDATLAGDSFGGIFTLYALFNRPDEFNRYIVGSPSLWWDNGMLFDAEEALSDRLEDLDKDIFLSVGALEEDAANPNDKDGMISNMKRMAKRLRERNYESLRLTEHIFEGETHLSVIPATFSRGLRAVFAPDMAAARAGKAAAAQE